MSIPGIPLAPLSADEFDELEQFLLYEVDTEDGMTMEMADGLLYAIAVGPKTVQPAQWLPRIWGTRDMMPPADSAGQSERMLGLVARYYACIVLGLESRPREVSPYWSTRVFQGSEYEDAEAWAFGFVEGMKLCWSDWQPLLSTGDGQSMFRAIGLLGRDDLPVDQEELVRTPGMRAELALHIPQAILDMHAHWLPLRMATHECEVARSRQPKVGRNEPCPCGSGKKFKKCCGAAADLH